MMHIRINRFFIIIEIVTGDQPPQKRGEPAKPNE
jgi:hypothetical protein